MLAGTVACQSNSMPTGSDIPAYPSALLAPIHISETKSEVGKQEFENFMKKYEAYHSAIAKPEFEIFELMNTKEEEVYMDTHNKLSPKAKALLEYVWQSYLASMNELQQMTLSMQDSEVKLFAERLIDVEASAFKMKVKSIQMRPNRYNEFGSAEFMQYAKFTEDFNRYYEKRIEARELLSKASYQLSNKYAK